MSNKQKMLLVLFLSTLPFGMSYSMSSMSRSFELIRAGKRMYSASVGAYQALPSFGRVRDVAGSVCLGVVGGAVLRSSFKPLDLFAKAITLGHPHFFDTVLGVILGVSTWRSVGESERNFEGLQHQVNALGARIAVVQERVGGVHDTIIGMRSDVGRLHGEMDDGFAGVHARFDAVDGELVALRGAAASNHEETMRGLADVRLDIDAKIDFLHVQGKRTLIQMKAILSGQREIRDLVVGLNNGSVKESECIKRIEAISSVALVVKRRGRVSSFPERLDIKQ